VDLRSRLPISLLEDAAHQPSTMDNEHPERSLAEAVKELITEDDLSDLALQGNDGS
jgi:hypothetical protein